MRIVFRVDASNGIGAGHVMRCAAIIEEAVSRKMDCIVVGKLGGLGWLESHLQNIGAAHVEDESKYQIDKGRDVLIIDSYCLPTTDSFLQEKNWKLVVSISDDLTPKYKAALVVHPGIDEFALAQTSAKLITGKKYIPLRKSISKSKLGTQVTNPRVVVFGGGSDKHNFALFMALGLAKMQGYESVMFFSSLDHEIRSLNSRFDVRNFGPELDTELESADLVFTTASTSSLEVIAREIPLGICCVADNQISYYEALTELEIAAGIGKRLSVEDYELDWEKIHQLIVNASFRQRLREKSQGFIDLSGSERILDEIERLLS
jgi:spore coat polysaccharide biosynthesis predicted glycosyltransferase SpsG